MAAALGSPRGISPQTGNGWHGLELARTHKSRALFFSSALNRITGGAANAGHPARRLDAADEELMTSEDLL